MNFLTNNRRMILAAVVVLAIIAGSIYGYQRVAARRTAVRYITRSVAYADIASTVTETGTINPVDVVQVGTQVSGTIAALNVDYNSRVKKGQVLATLDETSFRASVDQATATLEAAQATVSASQSAIAQARANLLSGQANVSKAQSQMTLSQLTVKRDQQLLAQGYIPQNQMDTDQTAALGDVQAYKAAQGAVQVAQAQLAAATAQAAASQHQAGAAAAQLQVAQYNLSKTVITSPVDGVVMARNVSVGQTVAASLQTPTLFTIASNLQDMQADTSVDEADVGNVRTGEQAQITVTAYPNVTFSGTVQQVRVNPTVVQNVVTYDAVVAVHDTSGRLLPGMTAQVTIDTGTRTHVLAVPTAALLFRPLQQRGGGSQNAQGGGAGFGGPGGGFIIGGPAGGGFSPANGSGGGAGAPVAGAPGSRVTVWVLRAGRPASVRVVIGLSDNRNVEITSGSLQEGDPVIIAQVRGNGQGRPGGAGGPGGGAGSSGGGPGGGGGGRGAPGN